MRKFAILIVTVLVVGCNNDSAGPVLRTRGEPPPQPVPLIRHAFVRANPHNVLSAEVHAEVRFADSAAVRFRLAATPEAEITTPDIDVASLDGSAQPLQTTVLGLLPASEYELYVVAWGRGGTTWSHLMDFATGELPSDLPRYTVSVGDPTPGYVVFRTGEYGLAIDNTGRVVWYRHLPGGTGTEFAATPGGNYVTWPGTADPTDPEPWVQVYPSGEIAGGYGCNRGLLPRSYDLLIPHPDPRFSNRGYWILCDEVRSMDLTHVGGLANAQVTGTAVQHVIASDYWDDYCPCPELHWSAFNHFQITDVDAAELTGPNVNWTDGNSMDFAADGNLIVSFGNLNEITKIDRATGRVMWRLGGLRNEFTFIDTPFPAFTRQHSVRVQGNEILLLDKLGHAGESRIERYALDEVGRTARLIQSFGAGIGVVATLGGSVQRLPNGHILASFGNAGRIVEFDAAGSIVWRVVGHAGNIARAQRIVSYKPGAGITR